MRRLIILIAGIFIPAILPAQLNRAWVNTYNGPYTSVYETAWRIATDASGYVYVCGSGTGPDGNTDYLTIKYDPATGDTLWVRYYNGPGNSGDYCTAIAVDNSGGVYVTGSCYGGSGQGDEYATVRYSAADGRQNWVAFYDGPSSDLDQATAIAVDNAGGVFVTGASYGGSDTDDDYATVRYSAVDGSQTWVARYNGPGSGLDQATAMAVDNAGGVFVTGASYGGSGTDDDYATVRYNASDGGETWVARYNGSGNRYDDAHAIAVDNAGGVYVTGFTSGYGSSYDYATVRYDVSDGSETWVARYNGPGNSSDGAYAIAVDNSGGVFVTGASYGGSRTDEDYVTIRYNATDGGQTWLARYDGPGKGYDDAYAVAVDNAGGVYVTGYSYSGPDTDDDYATIRYSATDGSETWVAFYNGPGNSTDQAQGIAVSSSGGVYVAGYSYGSGTKYDYATIRYSASSGSETWAARWNLSLSTEYGQKIVCDAGGYVYACGYGEGPTGSYDYITIKYDPVAGDTLWVRYYDGPGYGDDKAYAIAVDNAGGVYVTGQSAGLSTGDDYATVKYNTLDGSLGWPSLTSGAARYSYSGSLTDQATAIAADNAGGIYVTGYSTGSGKDYATVRYDASNGSQTWAARYDGPGAGDDQACAIAVDNSGGVYVTGSSYGGPGTGDDYATVKYNASGGSQAWFRRYNGPGSGSDQATAIAVDNAGGVYVTGASYGGSTSYDYATIKYDASAGDVAWTGFSDGAARYDHGVVNGPDHASAIVVNAGDVYVTGWSDGGSTSYDYATVKYGAADGHVVWTGLSDGAARYEGSGEDFAQAIAVDATGAYVTGFGDGSGTDYDYRTVSYDPGSGVETGNARYDGSAHSMDRSVSIATGAAGSVYVTGYCTRVLTLSDMVTIKYVTSQTPEVPDMASPASGATGQQVAGTLTWSAAAGATGYDVYLGADNPPTTKVSDGQTDLSYDYSGLAGNTVYYWQVVAENSSGETPSDVWNFTTGTLDVGVEEIVEPSGLIDTLKETPHATVHNYGTLTCSFDVWFEIRDSATNTLYYQQSATVTGLAGGGDCDPSFPEWDVPNNHEGRYYAKCYTALTGDINATNDTARSQFAVEAAPQQPPGWTQWSDVPRGRGCQELNVGACMATDPDGYYVYLLKGNNTREFYLYDPATERWTALESMPGYDRHRCQRCVREGATLAQVNGRFYATRGGSSVEFWEYNPAAASGHRWTQKADVPGCGCGFGQQSGASSAGVKVGDHSYVYLLKASESFEFCRYNVERDSWERMASAPGRRGEEFKIGSSITYDGVDTIFALKGTCDNFYAYVVSTNTWQSRTSLPVGRGKQAKGGAAICYHLRNVYCIKGSNSQEFWVYNCDNNTWTQSADIPLGQRRCRVQDGGALVYCRNSRYLFATKGSSLEFWSYGRLSNYGEQSPEEVISISGGPVKAYELAAGPSIVTDRCRVHYALPGPGNMTLKLYEVTGRVAAVLVDGWRESGRYSADIEAGRLARGTYILRFAAGDYAAVRKLIVQR